MPTMTKNRSEGMPLTFFSISCYRNLLQQPTRVDHSAEFSVEHAQMWRWAWTFPSRWAVSQSLHHNDHHCPRKAGQATRSFLKDLLNRLQWCSFSEPRWSSVRGCSTQTWRDLLQDPKNSNAKCDFVLKECLVVHLLICRFTALVPCCPVCVR